MKITFTDRVLLLNRLPQRGKFEDLILRADVVEKIKITQKELRSHNITTGDGNTTWSNGDKESEIEFTEAEREYIGKTLKDISDKGELEANMLSLYKLFK